MINYRPHYKSTASGFKGVYLDTRYKNPWRAMVRMAGNNGKNKQFHIGYYATPGEAAKAHDDYVKKLNK